MSPSSPTSYVYCLSLLLIVITTFTSSPTNATGFSPASSPFNRSVFPHGFIFGASSSAYQFEGAANEGGRGPSTWDVFTHKRPEKILDRSNGDVAIDFYHRYEGDVNTVKELGLDAFRISISWSRVIPTGRLKEGINKEGIRFYNNLIDSIIAKGLKPFVTLFHFDPPQGLEDEYQSFLSSKIVDDFKDFADLCFKEFGDRVKHWITLNEPYIFSTFGYGTGGTAPGRCSDWEANDCVKGDSGREPYIVAHNSLLAHAAVVKVYKNKYQESQKGVIGITLISFWYYPYSKSKADVKATKRAIDFQYGWFMDPLTKGRYPRTMRHLVGDRLPRFTKAQSEMVKGSYDFIGINYYTAYYVTNMQLNASSNILTDGRINTTSVRNGKLIGSPSGSFWLFSVPSGLKDLLVYTKRKYNNPIIYITENGVDEVNNESLKLEEALKDDYRIDYYSKHIHSVYKAIGEGADVRGYFAWSLFDNFEWNSGYTVRFGIYYVDYKDNLKRYPKKSAFWFRSFLNKGY